MSYGQMDVETIEGIAIHVLPDCAVCTLTNKSPLEMDECPEGDDVCHPDVCWRYDEPWGVVSFSRRKNNE